MRRDFPRALTLFLRLALGSILPVIVFPGCFVLIPFIEPHKKPEPQAARYSAQASTGPAQTRAATNKSTRYVNRYIKQLQDPRAPKRSAAASYLGMIGPDAAAAIPALIARLDDESKFVRRAVVKALGKIGVRSPEVENALEKARRDKDRYVAKSAQNAIHPLASRPADPGAGVSGSATYVMRSNRRVEKAAVEAAK